MRTSNPTQLLQHFLNDHTHTNGQTYYLFTYLKYSYLLLDKLICSFILTAPPTSVSPVKPRFWWTINTRQRHDINRLLYLGSMVQGNQSDWLNHFMSSMALQDIPNLHSRKGHLLGRIHYILMLPWWGFNISRNICMWDSWLIYIGICPWIGSDYI
jgi:hypothetical protein